MAIYNSKTSREKRNLLRLMGVVLAGLVILVFTNISCDSCKRSSPQPGEKPKQHLFSITPADGETIRHLSQPIFVSFPQSVQPSDFTFKIEPDPSGWKVIWDKSQKWVRLEHANPFAPQQQYHIKLSIKEGSFESHFKTLPPDPGELLESDLAQGVITPDEAARYHIMRVYNPKAVPEKYRYATGPRCGTWDMLQAANLRDRLKPETVKALEPYLVSAKNPKSIYYKRLYGSGQSSSEAAPSLIATAYAAAPSEPFEAVYQTDTGFRIVITGDPKEPSHAELVRKARDLIEKHKMYEKFERLLNRKTVDIGNNKTLLIFIFSSILETSDEDRTRRVSGFCKPLIENTESATTVPEISISGPLMDDDLTLASTLAHEMFHAFQFAFSCREQKWLTEGSATWAEDFIGHDWNTEQSRLRDTFQGAYHNPIITKNLDKAYGMYLFFYYLTQLATGGDETVMRQIWKNCAKNPGNTFESVRAALPGELSDVLKEYALFTLDVEQYKGKFPDAVGAYGGENPLNLSGHHKIRDFGSINADGTIEIERLVGTPGMGIMYFKVENKATGVTAPAIKFNLKEFLKNKAIGIQAVIKFRNGRKELEDWTGREERIFCLAKESQNFETLYLVASWAEETERIESLILDIEPALKEECLGAHLSITVSDYGQRDVKIISYNFGSSTTNETSSWDSKVVFDLDLASVTPITPVSKPVPYGDIKKLLPKEVSKKEASELAEFLKYGTHYDMGTHCPLAVFRVKSCRVSIVSGTKKIKKDHISYDDLGSLVEQYTSIYSESLSSEGLDKKTMDWWIYATEQKGPIGPGAINVHLDPKTKQIKWVPVDLPIGVNCRIDWSYEKEGIRREKSGYKTIKDSNSGSKKKHISPHKISKDSKDLPMNPDWGAKQSTKTTASGGGKKERSLDHESYDRYRRERVVTTGKHVETIEWVLELDVPPDIK